MVTGIRSSLRNAMETKRDSDTFVDAISAEDIGQFPDQNIAESLGRITGVTIDRASGEGQRITVRGLGPEFNLTLLNNRTLATVSGGRDFDFQVIASELISGVEVYKSATSDLVEGWMGGLVNMKTLRPLDNPGRTVAGSVYARYNDLGEDWGPNASFIYSNTFNNDTMGFTFGATYLDITQRLDYAWHGVWGAVTLDVDGSGPGGPIQFRRNNRAGFEIQEEERERLGMTAAFQWQPNDKIDLTVDALYVDFTRQKDEWHVMHPLQVTFSANNILDIEIDENGTMQSITKRDQPADMGYEADGGPIETMMLGLNTNFFISDDDTLEFDLAWSNAQNDDLNISMFPGIRGTCALDNADPDCVQSFNQVTWVNADIPQLTHSFDFTDTSLMRAHFNNSQRQDREDDIIDAKLNWFHNVDFGAFDSIEVGAQYFDRTFDLKTFGNDNNSRFPIQQGSPWSSFGRVNTAGRVLDLPDEIFGVLNVPDLLSDASGPIVRTWMYTRDYDALCAALAEGSGNPNGCDLVFEERNSTYVDETDWAAFARLNFAGEWTDGRTWRANVGARYVDTETTSNGWDEPLIRIYANDPTGGTTGLQYEYGPETEVVVTNSYDDWLFSGNFTLDISDRLLWRVAYADTLTRPNTGDIGTAVSYGGNFEQVNQTGGNPYLKPYSAKNWDTGFEWYHESGSAFTIGYFYKDIEDFISFVVSQYTSPWSHPAFGPIVINDRRRQNRPGGTVQGWEIGGILLFSSFTDGWLGNFGIQANYTDVDSKDKAANDNISYPDPQNVTPPTTGLEGFTPRSYNVIAFYEDLKINARLAYSWRDDFLDVRLGGGGLPEHIEAAGYLDFTFGYRFNETWQLRFEANNLTDERTLGYYDRRDRRNYVEYAGRRFQAGVRFNF
jgi:TonB-dependent receptor